MVTVAIVVLFLLGGVLGELQRRSRARIALLERSQTIDPATTLGTPFALQRELSHAVSLPFDLSIAEIRVTEVAIAKDVANALRAICAHGLDQLFCLDLARGSFLLMVYGKVDPDQVAHYFLTELEARRFPAKIGWAYTRSADPAIRQGVRAAAQAAVQRVEGVSGVEVALVEPGKWSADDLTDLVLGLPLRARREALCLTRREFAKIVGLSEHGLRDIEVGRARPAHVAKFILSVADTIEASVARVQHLSVVVAAAAKLPSPPTSAGPDRAVMGTDHDKASAAEGAIALQRSILAERSAGRSKGTVAPPPSSSAAADQPSVALKPAGEQPTTPEATVDGQGDADDPK